MASHELASVSYPEDQALMQKERGVWWKEQWKPWVAKELGVAVTKLDLDLPGEEIAQDPLKTALVNSLWSSTLACFGSELSAETLVKLNKARFGDSYVTEDVTAHVFTGNHQAVSCQILPLTSHGESMVGPAMVHHIPTFATVEGGKPTIGDISPIHLVSSGDGRFILSLETPSGYIWNKQLKVIPASAYTTSEMGSEGAQAMFKSIASPCVSAFQVLILRPDCQENCLMCTVPRGSNPISSTYQDQTSEALDVLIDEATKKGKAFQQTFSGGSLSYGDGGFNAQAWGMRLLAEKIRTREFRTGHRMPVQLQLEMILPSNKGWWSNIIKRINYYQQALGWQISLALNIEVIQDAWRPLFLRGRIKSTTSVEDHIAFAQQLAKVTAGKVMINSLVMFGMKPLDLSDEAYLTGDLEVLSKLVVAGIKPDYQPVKLENETPVEAFPPPNPIHLMIQDAVLKHLIAKAALPWSPGCVGGCNACDQSHETSMLIRAANRLGLSLPQVFTPLIEGVGEEYVDAYHKIFS